MTQPIRRFKAGACTASIFANELNNVFGKTVVHRVSLQRAYKDKSGAFRYTNSLQVADLPNAILVLQQAYEFLASGEADAASPGASPPAGSWPQPKQL